MDGDGDLDIVEAEADTPDGRVFWFENIDKASQFRFHLISSHHTGQDFHSLIVADFDNDGDADVVSGGGPLSQNLPELIIWKNHDGFGQSWEKHTILSDHSIHEAVGADVDRDGDIDICSKPWRRGLHIYLENQLIDE